MKFNHVHTILLTIDIVLGIIFLVLIVKFNEVKSEIIQENIQAQYICYNRTQIRGNNGIPGVPLPINVNGTGLVT